MSRRPAGGTGSAGPPRPVAAAGWAGPPPDSRWCRTDFGAENSGRAGRYGGAADRHAGRLRDFGRNNVPADAGHRCVTVAKRPAVATRTAAAVMAETSAPKGGRAAGGRGDFTSEGSCSGPARGRPRNRHFGAEGRRRFAACGASERQARHAGDCAAAAARPRARDSGGGQAEGWERDRGCCSYVDRGRGAGAAPGNNAGNRSRRTVCARRQRRARQTRGDAAHGAGLLLVQRPLRSIRDSLGWMDAI